MIDKRFVLSTSNEPFIPPDIFCDKKTLCSLKFVGERYRVYVMCCILRYGWSVEVFGLSYLDRHSKFFSTYLDCEEWLKKKGYL